MGARYRLFEALALAGASAFLCRCDGDGLDIVTRTTGFDQAMEELTGRLDEGRLLTELAAGWPADDTSTFVVRATTAPVWQCVVRHIGDDTHLVLFRVVDELHERNMTFFNVLQVLPDVVTRVDRNLRNLYISPAADPVVAPRRAQDLIGKNNRELGMPEHLVTTWQDAYQQVFDTGTPVEADFEFPAADGPRHFLYRIVPEFSPDGQVRTVLGVARDISQIKELQRKLELLAQTDSLTGLLNRRAFVDRLDAELARTDRDPSRLNVLILDLDDFKAINDSHGHIAGDTALEKVARVLQESIGSGDFAARFGGDEFCVALVDTTSEHAGVLADRIRCDVAAIEHPRVSVSIGVAAATPDDQHATDLIARVDTRMYQAKLAGKNHVDAGSR